MNERKNFMRTDTKEIVCRVAYLIGVKKPTLESGYGDECSELLEQLAADREATVIRYLCKIRTALMLKFKRTDDILRYDYINIDKIKWFDSDNIEQLEKWGIQVILPNKLAVDYTTHINRLIAEHINDCRKLFPDWLNWEYIKDLFILPKFTNEENQKFEFEKYMENLTYYPYQQYIHWKPKDYGNLLYKDGKFIEILYKINGDYFGDKSKYKNAVNDIKNNIYDFIRSSYKTVIVVDCENSDVYKLYGMLKNLNGDELEKIDKIVLYDDVHTTDGWDYLEHFISIPVEHIEVERITDYKSLVDIKVSTGVCREFYRNDVSSFILLSSDSDYWGLISSLPEAEFLVVVEWEKCGQAIKRALETSEIYYCSLDDFCSGNIEEFKRAVLISALKERLPDLLTYNGKGLARMLFEQSRIEASDTEIMNFYQKYIRTITLKADLEGNFSLEVKS